MIYLVEGAWGLGVAFFCVTFPSVHQFHDAVRNPVHMPMLAYLGRTSSTSFITDCNNYDS